MAAKKSKSKASAKTPATPSKAKPAKPVKAVKAAKTANAAPQAAKRAASPKAGASKAAAPKPALPKAAAGSIAEGSKAPAFSLPDDAGAIVSSASLAGKPYVLYFYPKDDTTGCAIEAKGIRDQYKDLDSRAVVLGVSTDTQDSHKAFADKYSLPFKLLDDSSHTLVTAFGVPVSSGHAKRVTFVIDKDGKVSKVFPNVNPDGHATELLEALKALG